MKNLDSNTLEEMSAVFDGSVTLHEGGKRFQLFKIYNKGGEHLLDVILDEFLDLRPYNLPNAWILQLEDGVGNVRGSYFDSIREAVKKLEKG